MVTRDALCVGMNDALQRALGSGDGLVASALCSHSVITAGLERGRLVRVLPGVYRDATTRPTLTLLARAAALHDPRSVVCGRAAAALTWWPELPVGRIDVARRSGAAATRPFRWSRRTVPGYLTLRDQGLAVMAPALSVVDLIPEIGGEVVDQALRRRVVRIDDLNDALAATPGRPGNGVRADVLHDSRDEPWSEAERMLHRIMRGLRLPWAVCTNYLVHTGPGLAFIDAAVPELHIGFEVDGYEHHGDRGAFEDDRQRWAELGLVGWQIVPFAAITLTRQEGLLDLYIERLTYRRARLLGVTPRYPQRRRAA